MELFKAKGTTIMSKTTRRYTKEFIKVKRRIPKATIRKFIEHVGKNNQELQ